MSLVRVRTNGLEFNVGAAHAEANGLEVLDESPRFRDGSLRPVTRLKGRKRKPRVSVAEAAEKKAEKTAANPTTDSKE
ncbi:hypothetical protein [Microbacterium sp.]|uniref:hypothetical protein n=1 Tax=Microbacterium sp. TaxID=51671 RepID=UPI00373619AB